MSPARTLALLLPVAVLVALSCRTPESAPKPRSGVLADPRLVALDLAAPFTAFDGSFGSLLLGDGWGNYETFTTRLDRMLERGHDFAWVVGGNAWIYFERPEAEQLDFFAECMPLRNPAERQQLTLTMGQRELARVELDDGWQQIRVALPERAIRGGWRGLRLSFRYAVRPRDVDEGPDERLLSAAFRRLALIPRQVDDAPAFLEATRLEIPPGGGKPRLRLARGAAVGLPLPPASEVTLRLDRLAEGSKGGDLGGCRLRFELEGRGTKRRRLWQGTAEDAGRDREVTFSTPAGGLRRLRLSLTGCGRGEYDPTAALEMPFTEELLSFRPSPARRERRARPHVFVYMIDTLRADSLSIYGSERRASPRLEELARDAVTYENAWSASAWTLPSVISALTGVYPDRHQVSFSLPKLADDNVPTLSARLKNAGYATLGVSQSFIISRKFGLHLGFDDFYLSDQLGGAHLRSQEIRTYLSQWLLHRWDGDEPVFAYLHTVDPHAPYRPSAVDRHFAEALPRTLDDDRYSPGVFRTEGYATGSPEVAQLRARYDGEVAHADRELGRFLDMLRYLGLYDDSVVVVTSDHGEEFGEHGGFDHGRTMYEEMLRVPLIVKYPGSAGAGTTIDAAVSTVDLVPTLLRLAGADLDAAPVDGQVLPPIDRGEQGEDRRRFLFSEVKTLPAEGLAPVHYRAFRLGSVKCIESVSGNDQFGRPIPRWRAFDLAGDPSEERPLEDDDPRLVRCRETLERWVRSRSNGLERALSVEDLEEEILQRLRALGYVE